MNKFNDTLNLLQLFNLLFVIFITKQYEITVKKLFLAIKPLPRELL